MALSSTNLVLCGLCLICQQAIVVGKVFVYKNSTNQVEKHLNKAYSDLNMYVYLNTLYYLQLMEEYDDLPALFGPDLPGNDLRYYVGPHDSNNLYGCKHLRPPPRRDYPTDAKFVAIMSR